LTRVFLVFISALDKYDNISSLTTKLFGVVGNSETAVGSILNVTKKSFKNILNH
jgi:hypothetical protein